MYHSHNFTFGDSSFSSTTSPSNSSSSGAFVSPTSSGSDDASSAEVLPIVLENGRKVFGPPRDYTGARPSYLCELFIAHVPEQLDEATFLMWLQRCGVVYEFRLMMDSGNSTRGYGFVRFMRESESLAACELLSFFFINGERLRVFRSQGKNRLYVSNIPRELPLEAMSDGFKKIFRDMQCCTAYPGITEANRGYAFIEFQDHEDALEAKKRTTPGRVRMWGCDLKVQWAKPKQTDVARRRLFAGYQANANFTQPSLNDYCAKLRLFCLANNWCIPVVVYGRSFRQYGVQYGGILLWNAVTGQHSRILMEVAVAQVRDIHVLMCEVAVLLIERNAGFPGQNYVLRIWGGAHAELVKSFTCIEQLKILNLGEYLVSTTALIELADSLGILTKYHPENLLRLYRNSFLGAAPSGMPTMNLDGQQSFYAIIPKFRNNPPLNNNFNNTEIVLMQAVDVCASNPLFCQSGQQLEFEDILRLKSQHSIPMALGAYTLRYVDVLQGGNGRWFYHPEQGGNSHPIWILGHTYQRSIFEQK